MANEYLNTAAQYIHEGCWLNAQHVLRLALPVATASQRGYILTALKACKLAIAERSR